MSSAGDSPWVISKKYDAWGPPVDASRKRGGDALVAWGAPPGRGGYGPRLGGLDNRGLPVDFKKQTQYKRQKPIAGASKSTASFVDSAMPLIMLMQVGIAFPVQRRADGRLQWKILSPIWLYTLVVYGVLTVPVVFAASAAVRQLAKEDNTFHDQIYNMTPLLLLHAHPLLPFMHWLEAYFVAGYFNSWIKFEELFHKVCRRPLHMGLRGYVARMAAFSFAVAAFLTGTMPMYMSLSWLQCLAYLHLYLLAICLVSVWLLSSKALCIAAEALRESMHEMVVTGACTAERMADYRQAWLELSELTQESGSAWTYQCGHQLLYLFLLMTVTSFGVLAGVARHSLEARTLAYGALAAGSAFILFIVCSAAETAADRWSSGPGGGGAAGGPAHGAAQRRHSALQERGADVHDRSGHGPPHREPEWLRHREPRAVCLAARDHGDVLGGAGAVRLLTGLHPGQQHLSDDRGRVGEGDGRADPGPHPHA
ncbi:gustatory and odorant receptor 22-like isoform X1 [Frankliniella occidentalis]|uniref:Gustatory receptor n=1 Tax=Frankliniella occidentalis TaxID=133901 RepID=A0A6J1TGX7_FRAOC|nr:gustatory and odorant receptor 22-like isoform X1 [Frankliniella occidentalis]